MSNCPYPEHESEISVNHTYNSFYTCSDIDFCKRPSFKCYHNSCDAINRIYAKHCTLCGKKIDYSTAYKNAENKLSIDPQFSDLQKGPQVFFESETEKIRSMMHYFGYLVVDFGKDGVILFNGISSKLEMLKKVSFEKNVIGINKPNFFHDSKEMNFILVTTENSIEKISIDSLKVTIIDRSIYEKDETIIRDAFFFDDESVLVFITNSQGEIVIRHFKGDSVYFKAKLNNEKISLPIWINNEEIFFYSATEIYVYKHGDLRIEKIKTDSKLNINYCPVIADDIIIIPGHDMPYYLDARDDSLNPVQMFKQGFGIHRISLDERKKNIYITHNQGLTIANIKSESIQWDLKNDLRIGSVLPCLQFRAQDVGKYILFSAQSINGSQIGFLPSSRDDLYMSKAESKIICEPLVILNKLILAVEENNRNKLKAITLCA